MDMASNIAEKLIKDGKMSRARVGIALQPLSPAIAKQLGLDPKTRGVLVGEIVPGSPAEKAGLKPGDVITSFNDQPIVSMPTFRLTVAASDVGKSFSLTYFRDGKEHKTKIVPASADQVVFAQEKGESTEEPEEKTTTEPAKTAIHDFGLEVQPLTPELAKPLGYGADVEGLLVSSVKEGSPAESAGLEAGYVITKVVKDQKLQTVKAVKDFQDLAGKADELALYVRTPKGSRFVTLSKTK
jgi:serine protease Do